MTDEKQTCPICGQVLRTPKELSYTADEERTIFKFLMQQRLAARHLRLLYVQSHDPNLHIGQHQAAPREIWDKGDER